MNGVTRDPLDVPREECGVFGIYNHKEAARLAYLGLQQLQHRGQESAGIVTSDGNRFFAHVSMGLVADVFKPEALDRLKGRMAVGHVRYATAGSSSLANAQPIVVTTARGPIAIGHNGNLTNAMTLRKKMESLGSIFQTSSDTEVILHLMAKSPAREIVTALKDALSQVTGAYSLVIQTTKSLYAVRDPWGVRPLHLGRLNGSIVVASETCAFDIIGAKLVREVKPGEIVAIDHRGARTVAQMPSPAKAHCVFEYVYFARPDSHIFGKSVYEVRREMGRQLAREAPAKADIVVAVPDSANVAAVGYADESGIPLEIGLIRSHYRGRTFIEPKQSIRDFGARMKYAAVVEALKGRRVVVIDDSIVRGTTSRKLIRMLRHSGAREIHLRISSPPIMGPCFYGIDTPQARELIATRMNVERIRQYLNTDSLKYLSLEGMLKATGRNPKEFCTACFNTRYPIPVEDAGRVA
ncbi:MAG: amidophosphoribosyltransferase [Elusimicrobia bacterium]|nr:amidophosphoribosyltransferase [Elusimicrobiota bacterium]